MTTSAQPSFRIAAATAGHNQLLAATASTRRQWRAPRRRRPHPQHQMRQTTLFDALPRARPQQPQARRAHEPDALDRKLDLALSAVFGHQGFRPGQRATCRAAAQGRDCVVILPTGGGKSLCYQLPAVITKGVTIVVSPLLSLIEDQVSTLISLERCGGVPAAHLTSSTKETTSEPSCENYMQPRRGASTTPR